MLEISGRFLPTSLVLLPNWLGDAAMCTPALRALRRRFPGSSIAVAGSKAVCELLHGLPWLDEVFVLPHRPGIAEMFHQARKLRPYGKDLTVVFPHSFRAAFLARLIGSSRRIGYARNGRSLLFTDAIPPYSEGGRIRPVYMAQEYLDLVKCLGCEDDGTGLELRADPAAMEDVRRRVESRLGKEGPLVGVAPGAAFGPSKRWPAERYGQVVNALTVQAHARCVLLTGPDESDTRAAVLSATQAPPAEVHDGQPSIENLKAAIAQLDLLICNDSGPRHIAVAFHVPVICIMGPTSPRYTAGPYEQGEVLRVNVDCGPCQKPVCETDHRCMTLISTERVIQAALRHLPR